MRCVVAAPGTADAAAAARPDRARLETVRHLGRRFPQAELRPLKLARAAELDARADPSGSTRVWLALESLQVTGSFKVRGALVALDALGPGRLKVVAASAGNHGAADLLRGEGAGSARDRVCPAERAGGEAVEDRGEHGAELVLVQSDHFPDEAPRRWRKELAVSQGCARSSRPTTTRTWCSATAPRPAFDVVDALGRAPERILAPFGGGGLATGLAWGMAAESGGTSRVGWCKARPPPRWPCRSRRGAAVGEASRREERRSPRAARGRRISVDGFAPRTRVSSRAWSS